MQVGSAPRLESVQSHKKYFATDKQSLLEISRYLFVSELDLRASVEKNLAKIRDLAYLRLVRREFLPVVGI